MSTLTSDRLQDFLLQWRYLSPQDHRAERLRRFLDAFRPLRPLPPLVPQPRAIDAERIASLLGHMREPLERMRVSGGALNPWAIAGVRRQEVRNSAILATLWSPQACGSLGRQFLDAFCRSLADPSGALPTAAELSAPYSVRREHCPAGEASERVDMTIEGATFVLGIEVKIDAPQGPEQLHRYANSIRRWGHQRGGKKTCVVYLARDEPNEPGVLSANWRDVIAAGRAILRANRRAPSFHSFLLNNFLRHASEFGD